MEPDAVKSEMLKNRVKAVRDEVNELYRVVSIQTGDPVEDVIENAPENPTTETE